MWSQRRRKVFANFRVVATSICHVNSNV